MHFVVDAGFIAVERDVAAIRLGGPNVVSSCGFPPDGLFFRIDNSWLGKFFHLKIINQWIFTHAVNVYVKAVPAGPAT